MTITSSALSAQPLQRHRVSLNEGWRFLKDAPQTVERADFDDGAWERVRLPHTWNSEDTYDKTPGYSRGLGTYHRMFLVDTSFRGKRIFLEFEGVNQVAEVYVNGSFAGRHIGGYTLFRFDITSLVRFGGKNFLAVLVNNGHDPFIPPLEADFNFYGGIYRDAWLLAVDPLHIDMLDAGGPGVYVTTVSLTRERAVVSVRTRVSNHSLTAKRAVVRHEVLSPLRNVVVTFESLLRVEPDSTKSSESTSPDIPSPLLWSPESPDCYIIRTSIVSDGVGSDLVEVPLGFRTLSWSGDGIVLNGVRRSFIGTNRHQDYPDRGNAITDDQHRLDIAIIKETGFDFVRLAHYPQDPSVLAETDRLGLAVWEEIPVVNQITRGSAFADNAESMLVEMIRQHYNHPSVLIWGIMNEAQLRLPQPMPPRYKEDVAALARRLHARAKREDPNRPTALALSQGEIANSAGLDEATDIMGLNLYFGWYGGTFEELGQLLDRMHAERPSRPLFVSEYGAGSDERVHASEPERFDFSSEYMQEFHRASFAQILSRTYLVGSAVWSQFDFGADHRQDTKNALNQKGLYFYDRSPKDVAHYYRAKLSDGPVLHVEREQLHRAGSTPKDRLQSVRVYTNTDTVWLRVAGKAVDRKAVVDATADFDAVLSNGEQVIEAMGTRGKETLVDRVVMSFDDRSGWFSGTVGTEVVIAVNAGARYSYLSESSIIYEPDRPYEGSGWGFIGGKSVRTYHRVLGTNDDALFQSTRDSASAYMFHIPDGEYEVSLGFLETLKDDPGGRVFDVLLNGRPFLTSLDIAASVGRWRGAEFRAISSVTDGRGLQIRFVPRIGNPTISHILIRRR